MMRADEPARIRRWAVEQVTRTGARVEAVAEALGYGRSTVFGWVQKYAACGLRELQTKLRSGRPPKLTSRQRVRLVPYLVGTDPRHLRFAFALWTREMVAELIEVKFEVVMSPSGVGRILRRMGLSPQPPGWRAYQADPQAVATWRTVAFPLIKAEAAKVGGIVFLGDEASVRSDYHAGTTWGRVGQTPVVPTTGARYSVNMISAVSARGKLHFRIVEGKVNAAAFIDYCERLRHDHPRRPVFLIVDGHPAHWARAVRDWVASTNGRFRLFYLPGYSPQLNPDEWVWKNVKHDRIGKAGITSLEDLRSKAEGALQRLAGLPHLVKSFFADPKLQYIVG